MSAVASGWGSVCLIAAVIALLVAAPAQAARNCGDTTDVFSLRATGVPCSEARAVARGFMRNCASKTVGRTPCYAGAGWACTGRRVGYEDTALLCRVYSRKTGRPVRRSPRVTFSRGG